MIERRIVTIIGARPQFIKAAALDRAFGLISDSGNGAQRLVHRVIHTGQHFDKSMSELIFDDLGLSEPSFNLAISGGTDNDMTGRMLCALDDCLRSEKADLVLLFGDTNSTLAGAIAAAKLEIPIAHVEAGVRSFNRQMPEEINRVLCDQLSTLMFCPTEAAVRNLNGEGKKEGVYDVGDVMYEVFSASLPSIDGADGPEVFGLSDDGYVLLTLHRQENVDDKGNLVRCLEFARQEAGELPIVLPLHPRTRNRIETFGLSLDQFHVIEPQGYFIFQRLLRGAAKILTDSGGVQKEAYYHRVPCVTLRDETEWNETITNGWNKFWSAKSYEPRNEIPEYERSNASRLIVDEIAKYLS